MMFSVFMDWVKLPPDCFLFWGMYPQPSLFYNLENVRLQIACWSEELNQEADSLFLRLY